MRMTQGMRAKEVARQVGWSVATVHIFQSRWAREGDKVFEVGKRGGRRREYLSKEEEESFLAPFVEQVKAGHPVTTREIWHAYEARVGRSVVASTVYRLLARSGWEKVMPRARHSEVDRKN
ncbi:MAG: winged helix-turn-helix domain-containing protein [Candidatus Accumulibacter sp.]|nr:winged helix-turn-helix domain-containing protein [Accumulibacter sp.]